VDYVEAEESDLYRELNRTGDLTGEMRETLRLALAVLSGVGRIPDQPVIT
jgi:hypothetical protein